MAALASSLDDEDAGSIDICILVRPSRVGFGSRQWQAWKIAVGIGRAFTGFQGVDAVLQVLKPALCSSIVFTHCRDPFRGLLFRICDIPK